MDVPLGVRLHGPVDVEEDAETVGVLNACGQLPGEHDLVSHVLVDLPARVQNRP